MNAYARTLLVGLLLISSLASGTDGDFDPTFGDNGIALFGPSQSNHGLYSPLVQPDGKILACYAASYGSAQANFGVMRLQADGSLDASFGNNGRIAIDFGSSEICYQLALQPDGRIVAAGATFFGWKSSDYAIARIEADGSLDTSFGAGTGRTIVAVGEEDAIGGIAIQADGKIVIVGASGLGGGGNNDFTVVRLRPDGSRDNAFGNDGVFMVTFDSFTAHANAVAIDAANRIVVVGSAWIEDIGSRFVAARFLPTGSLDSSFSGDGKVTFDFGISGSYASGADALVLQGDGKISMAGDVSLPGRNWDMAVVRLLQNGLPDAGFGSGGKVIVPFDLVSDGPDFVSSIVWQADGKLAIGGIAYGASDTYGAVARLTAHGSLDSQFGMSGKRTFSLVEGKPSSTTLEGLALQGSQIVAVGTARGDADEIP